MTDRGKPAWQTVTADVEQTMAVGGVVARHTQPGDVIGLDGQLGAGKTQFVRGMARALGVDPRQVSSPTFVLVHEYETPGDRPLLVHIDAYRMGSLADLESIGWDVDRLAGSDLLQHAVVVVEWATRLGDTIGDDALHVELQHVDETSRRISLRAHGDWQQRLPSLIADLPSNMNASDNNANAPTTPCPICDAPVPAAAATFPFCSKRCRQIDLGKWISGDYKVSRPIEQRDLEEGVD